jgi:TonB-linked SusC/RagA family outer membrane protein
MRKLTLSVVAVLLFMVQALAQRNITGRVTDEAGKPLAGISVSVKGTSAGTTTNTDGVYSLTVPSGAKTLSFSGVDFESQELNLGAGSALNVSMTSTEKALTEVVVTGYGREKKRQFTGAATVLGNKQIQDVPVVSFDQNFQGRVPGLLANSGSGQPGAAANVRIRGTQSITGAFVQPLYVLDGIPISAGDFATLNPNDFESITVLKDAGAAALYGARGGLGVIVITSKRGKAGQATFSYRTQTGITERPAASQFQQMNSREMLDYEEFVGGFAPGLTAPGWIYSRKHPNYAALPATSPSTNPFAASKARYDFLRDSLANNNVDYYDLLFRRGVSQTHEINMNGGTANNRYFVSLNYFQMDGTDRKSRIKRYTARFNLDNTVGKLNIQFNNSIGYSITDYNEGAFYAGNGTANPFAMAWRAKPYENPYNANGDLIFGPSTALVPRAMANLIERSNNSTWVDKQVKAVTGLTLAYRVFPSVTIKNTSGIDAAVNFGQGFINANSYVGSLQSYQAGYLNESQVARMQLINTSGIVYNKLLNDRHDVELGGYFEVVRGWNKGFGFNLFNLDPRLSQTGQGAGTLVTGGAATFAQNGNSAKSGFGIRSYFASGRYTLDNKYTLTANVRRDGTSRILNPDNKEITTWAAGITWDALKENFLRNVNWLSDLRVRATYGVVPNIGSIPGGSFGISSNFYSVPGYLNAQLPAFGTTAYAGSPLTGLAPGVANPNLRIETVAKANIGLDLGFFRNRLRLSVEAYRNLTRDLFVSQRLVATSGFYGSSLNVNAGTMSNRGLEFDFAVDIIRSKDQDLTFRANHAININKIEDLGSVTEYPSGTGIIKEGLPFGQHYSYWYLGADPATGRPQYKKPDGTTTTNINEAGQFHEFGTWLPKHVGGFSLDYRFKQLTISALFSYQLEVRRYNNVQNWVTQGDATYTGAVTQSRMLLTEQWRKPGDVKMIQSPAFSRQFTSYDISDAKFLRFRNLNVAYNLNAVSIGKVRLMKSGRFYVQAQNLAIWSPWSGLDPEDDNNISLAEFPNPKAFVAGLDINF